MTRDDIIRMAQVTGLVMYDYSDPSLERFANLVAAAEREATQKPVAWMHIEEGELIAFEDDKNTAEQCEYCVPLYTAPPQREWIGLTDEEIQQIEMSASSKLSAIYLVEAKLKGKNGGC